MAGMLQQILKNTTSRIEFPVFLLFLAFMTSESVLSNLIIYRTCYVTLGYKKEECFLLGSQNPDNQTAKLEKLVEPYAAVITMFNTITECASSAIICLFIGPWSDKFGRKPIQITVLLGYTLCYLMTIIFSTIENMSPWATQLTLIPVILTGGISSYISVVCCYVTDLSNDVNRGLRMSFLETAMFSGIVLGTLFSSHLLTAAGYNFVFLFSAFCCLLALLYSIFLPESLEHPQSQNYIKEIFQLDSIREMIKTTFKKRPQYTRFTILCCILMSSLRILCDNGTRSATFLFLREKFHWSLYKYTTYMAAANVFYVIGTLGGVYYFNKFLKIPETLLIFVALLSCINGALMSGLAENDYIFYIIPFAAILNGVFNPMIRSLVSKILPPDDLGKIFALLTASQFLIGTGGSPLYTFIYNSSISTHPEAFNFVSAGIYGLLTLAAIVVIAVRTVQREMTYLVLHQEN